MVHPPPRPAPPPLSPPLQEELDLTKADLSECRAYSDRLAELLRRCGPLVVVGAPG